MKYEIDRNPFFHIIIHDVFSEEENKKIFDEAIKNKKLFKAATIFSGMDKKFRDNKVAYYDQIYLDNRKNSTLIVNTEKLFQQDVKFREVLSSSPPPFYDFGSTNFHETQVSRYGDKQEKYHWHVDRYTNFTRTISIVYYFFKEPRKWSGGEFQFTNSPIYKGKILEEKANIKSIIPENNMMVVFAGNYPHQVLPTKSPRKFDEGRFSMNCWIGIQ